MQVSLGKEMTKIGYRLVKPLSIAAVIVGLYLSFEAVQEKFWEMRTPVSSKDEVSAGSLYPVGAVNFLKESQFEGNLMTPFGMGAFVSWNLYPEVKVSIDSRYEAAYPPGAVEASFDFYDAKAGWQQTLDSHGTDAVLIPHHSAVRTEFDSINGWHLQYSDPIFSIYSRQEPTGEPTIVETTSFDWEF